MGQTDFIARAASGRTTTRASRIYDDRYDPDLARQAVQRISKSLPKRRRFFWALTYRAADLQSDLRRLDKKLINLDRFSRRCAETLWPGTFGPLSDLPWKKRQQSLTAPSAADGSKVQSHVQALHKARGTGQNIRYFVGLTTPRPNGKARNINAVEIVVRQNGKGVELLLKPEEFERAAKTKRTFHAAADEFLSLTSATKSEHETYLVPSGAAHSDGFVVTSPKEKNQVLSQVIEKADLTTRLRHSRNIHGKELLSQEYRTAMTTSLVDGCFRFLGSEWLDNMSSGNLRGGRGAQGIWKMALGSNAVNRSIDTQFENIKTAAQGMRSKRDLTRHTHVFRLALVLVELLLDVEISQVQKKDGRFVVDVFVRSIKEGALSAEELADRVEEKSQSKILGDLIYFCLSSLQDSEMVQEQHLDEKFYARAFLPAYEMSNALIRRRG